MKQRKYAFAKIEIVETMFSLRSLSGMIHFHAKKNHLKKELFMFKKRHILSPNEKKMLSTGSVESLNTLIGWANHNPYEDEQSTDSDNLTDWDNRY
ncbi:hypothetical protein E3N88_10016 [Mikania micrantha]|uniref:Uncharacterized protein n=1 Tax=Mikania micrantha TaxID=192012 RepID=A0A5N6P9H1_9ASTR|nr:hypothetical protein E3N88_10016 [Mikania micrantha]